VLQCVCVAQVHSGRGSEMASHAQLPRQTGDPVCCSVSRGVALACSTARATESSGHTNDEYIDFGGSLAVAEKRDRIQGANGKGQEGGARRWKIRYVAMCLGMWHWGAAGQVRRRAVALQMTNQLLSAALQRWQGNATESKAFTAKATMVLRVVLRWQAQCFAVCLDVWRKCTQEDARKWRVMRNCLARLEAQCVAVCLDAWRKCTQEEARTWRVMRNCLARLANRSAAAPFETWAASVCTSRWRYFALTRARLRSLACGARRWRRRGGWGMRRERERERGRKRARRVVGCGSIVWRELLRIKSCRCACVLQYVLQCELQCMLLQCVLQCVLLCVLQCALQRVLQCANCCASRVVGARACCSM